MGNETLAALFANSDDAQRGIVRLFNIGLPAENIGFLGPNDVLRRKSASKRATASTVIGALSLAILGGALGASVIGLSNMGAAAVAAAVGILFGGYAGAIVGGLFGAEGLTDDETYFMREIQAGRTLVVASLPDWRAEDRAAAALHGSNALVVDSLGSGRLQVSLRHPSGRTMLEALAATEETEETGDPKAA